MILVVKFSFIWLNIDAYGAQNRRMATATLVDAHDNKDNFWKGQSGIRVRRKYNLLRAINEFPYPKSASSNNEVHSQVDTRPITDHAARIRMFFKTNKNQLFSLQDTFHP